MPQIELRVRCTVNQLNVISTKLERPFVIFPTVVRPIVTCSIVAGPKSTTTRSTANKSKTRVKKLENKILWISFFQILKFKFGFVFRSFWCITMHDASSHLGANECLIDRCNTSASISQNVTSRQKMTHIFSKNSFGCVNFVPKS